jgi:hypothetical protein
MAFLKEFFNSSIWGAEYFYRLVELQNAVSYVESLDWNIFDEHGILIPVNFLEKKILEEILNFSREYFAVTKVRTTRREREITNNQTGIPSNAVVGRTAVLDWRERNVVHSRRTVLR